MIDPVKSEHVDIRYENATGFLCVTVQGRIERADAAVLVETTTSFLTNYVGRRKPYYLLIDIRHASSISPEARKYFADAPKASPAAKELELGRRLAFFGGSLPLRAISNLLMQALSLAKLALSKAEESLDGKWTLEADEAAARAWLTEQKRIDLAAAPPA